MADKETWRNLPDDELNAELKRREIDYRNFVDEQQFKVNAKARRISEIKSEMFKRAIAAQKS